MSRSFVGHVEQAGIRLSWETDSETVDVSGYSLRRFPGDDLIYSSSALGACGEPQAYRHVDSVAAVGVSHRYELTVHRGGDTSEACAVWTEPLSWEGE